MTNENNNSDIIVYWTKCKSTHVVFFLKRLFLSFSQGWNFSPRLTFRKKRQNGLVTILQDKDSRCDMEWQLY